MRFFQGSPAGTSASAIAELDLEERAVIARVVADVALLLGGEPFGTEIDAAEVIEEPLSRHLPGLESRLTDPDDPAVLRVLPNAAPDDREVADEFRRFTEPELRSLKIDRLRTIWTALNLDGPEWVIPESDAMSTAAALTDVRLVLASRLGLDTDEDATALHAEFEHAYEAAAGSEASGLAQNPERMWLGMLYEMLTWLQQSLMTYVMRDDV